VITWSSGTWGKMQNFEAKWDNKQHFIQDGKWLIPCAHGKYLTLKCYWPFWILSAQQGEKIHFWNGTTHQHFHTSSKRNTVWPEEKHFNLTSYHSGSLVFSSKLSDILYIAEVHINLHQTSLGIKLRTLWMSLVGDETEDPVNTSG
jgi:hypothetical protein